MDRSAPESSLDGNGRSDELAYRSVSPLAVLGLVLAIVSPIAFMSRLLWVAPLIAVFVSWLAVRSIRRDPETKTGLGIAAAAFAIAVAVAAASYTRGAAADRLHNASAAGVADRFVELLAQGDTIGAIELTQAHQLRRPSRETAGLYYESDEVAAQRLADFEANPVVARVVANGEPRPSVVSVNAPLRKRGGGVLTSRLYTLSGEPGLRLVLERSSPRATGAVSWRVSKYDFAGPGE